MSAGCPNARWQSLGPAPTHKVTALSDVRLSRPLDQAAAGRRRFRWRPAVTVMREDGPFAVTREGLYLPQRAPRIARRQGTRFRRGRRTLCRHALSLGRQEQPRHRLLGPRADIARCRRHRLPARQRHAAGFARPAARSCGSEEAAARRPPVLEGPCRDRARCRDDRACQRASHGDRDREYATQAIARIKAAGSELVAIKRI